MDKVLLMYGWNASDLLPILFTKDSKQKKKANDIWDILCNYDYAYDTQNGKFLIIGTIAEVWNGDKYALFDRSSMNVNHLEDKCVELQRRLYKYWKPSAAPKFYQVSYGEPK